MLFHLYLSSTPAPPLLSLLPIHTHLSSISPDTVCVYGSCAKQFHPRLVFVSGYSMVPVCMCIRARLYGVWASETHESEYNNVLQMLQRLQNRTLATNVTVLLIPSRWDFMASSRNVANASVPHQEAAS